MSVGGSTRAQAKIGMFYGLGAYILWGLVPIYFKNVQSVPPREMLRELMEDNKKMAAAMRKAHKLCDDHEDSGTASLLEVFIDETERRTWFLFEASRQEGANAA